MFSTSSNFGDLRSQSQSQQSQAASTSMRPGLPHSSTSFNIATMLGASTSTPTNQLPPSWSSTLGGNSILGASTAGPSVGGASSDPFASSLSSQRPTYLPGYLMSSMQGMPLPEGNQRFEDPPLLQTKNAISAYGRSTPSTFGAESDGHMREPMDEDAPPTESVFDSIGGQPLPRTNKSLGISRTLPSPLARSNSTPSQTKNDWFDLIVFGYPPDKYDSATRLFQSLGETNEPEPGPAGGNYFKIGFKNQWEAARAVRKNGELIVGTWMVGVKWADPTQAELSQYITPPRAVLSSAQSATEEESPDRQGLTRSRITPHFGMSITPISSNSIYRKRPQGPGLGLGSGGKDEGDWAAAHADSAKKPGESKNLFSSIIGW